MLPRSLPAWGVWIEIMLIPKSLIAFSSLPAWGVWIEIVITGLISKPILVTPRMGSVD